MRSIACLVVVFCVVVVGCGGSGGTTTSVPIQRAQPAQGAGLAQNALLLYPGQAPSTAIPSGAQGSGAMSLTLRNPASLSLTALTVGGAQYLVSDPNYTGTLTVTSSCGAENITPSPFDRGNTMTWSFENNIVLGSSTTYNEATGATTSGSVAYSYSPGATGTGPAALLDVGGSSTFGPQFCTLTISDAGGKTATIAVNDQRMMLYSAYRFAGGAAPANGTAGSVYELLANFGPISFLVYEHGYAGAYTLQAPVGLGCGDFNATLQAATAQSPAVLAIGATGSISGLACTFTVTDASGQAAMARAYYENTPTPAPTH